MWIKDTQGNLHETTGASIVVANDEILLVASGTGAKNAERKILLARGFSEDEARALIGNLENAIVREQQLVSILN